VAAKLRKTGMRYTWLYLCLLLCLQLSGCQQGSDAAYQLVLRSIYNHSIPTLSATELQLEHEHNPAETSLLLAETPLLLDTRSLREFQVSHLPGARYMGYDEPDLSVLKDVSLDTPLVLYCAVGYRSEKVGEQLLALGYTQVRHLHGGLFDWVNQGLPVYNTQGQTDSVHAYTRSWGIWLRKGQKVYD
jgi:rhodanese-related sulfurtransferase